MQSQKDILITFIVTISLISIMLLFIAGILFLYQKKQHQFLKHLEQLKNSYERSLIEMQEQALQHMSREIHDNIGQYFTLAKLHLNMIDFADVNNGPVVVESVVDLITKGLDDLRDLSRSLSIEVIRNGGLTKAIDTQVKQLIGTGQYKVAYDIIGNYNFLDDEKEIIVFRILQESVNNIIRHAAAKHIDITLDCRADLISLVVSDDGKGFEVDEFIGFAKNMKHSGGVNNMKIRASAIGATLSVKSILGQGTTVSLVLPIN